MIVGISPVKVGHRQATPAPSRTPPQRPDGHTSLGALGFGRAEIVLQRTGGPSPCVKRRRARRHGVRTATPQRHAPLEGPACSGDAVHASNRRVGLAIGYVHPRLAGIELGLGKQAQLPRDRIVQAGQDLDADPGALVAATQAAIVDRRFRVQQVVRSPGSYVGL